MRRALTILAVGLCLPLLACKPESSTPAAGGAGGKNAGLRAACEADIQKLCAGESKKFRKCLRKNEAQLTEGCKTALKARKGNKERKKNKNKDQSETTTETQVEEE